MLKTESLPDFATLPEPIRSAIQSIPKHKHYLFALSGGLDSVALMCSALSYLKDHSASVRAIHVHHGLSSNASEWGLFCRSFCEGLGVELIVEEVVVEASGEGLESAARQARYGVFEKYMQQDVILLQGHHQNDQAETFLLRAAKGLGPEALASIPSSRNLGEGRLLRPFLRVDRSVLAAWAERAGLSWVEDESNADLQFDRNFVRHEVLPVLESRWADVAKRLAGASHKAARTIDQLNQWNEFYLESCSVDDGDSGACLCLAKLSALPLLLQQSVVRFWIDRQSIPHPPESSFERIWTELIPAKDDANPEIRWGAHQLVRFDGKLYCIQVQQELDSYQYEFDIDAGFSTTIECGSINLDLTVVNGSSDESVAGKWLLKLPCGAKKIRVQNRQGGERFKATENGVSRPLKKCYQDWKIPPWRRNAPLLFFDDELVFSGAGYVAAGLSPKKGDAALIISLESLA